MPYEKDQNEIGALWDKQSARGTYMTGKINGENVVAFRNTNKRNDKSPDWRVLRAMPRGDRPATRQVGDDDIPY